MTALDPASVPGPGGLAALAGPEMAAGQLTPLVTVLRAEQARRTAGIAITRPVWKNLVFAGGPGTGKSRAAAAIARLYRDLGVLSYGNLIEVHAAGLAGATAGDTATQIREAVTVTGDLVMITGAHAWHDLPGRGQHLLRCLYQLLTEARKYHGDELAVILAGQAGPLRDMLHAAPALAARKAAAVLADAGNGHVAGNARLASSCSPRPPSARRTASPPVLSPVTRPPSPPSVMHGNARFDLARWRRA